MSKPKVLIDWPPLPDTLPGLEPHFELVMLPEQGQAEYLAQHGAGIEYAMTGGFHSFPAWKIAALPDLRVASNYGVGYDGVDVGAAVERGIVVTHTPDVLNDEVANTAILLILAAARNFLADNAYLRDGRWATQGMAPLSRSISAMTVGILGMGRIGQAIAAKLAVFGCETVYHSRTAKDVPYRFVPDLTEMAQQSDVLVIITTGGAATRNLVNRDVIEALGPTGILVNVARGSVVDEPEMVAALQDGRLGAVALDVFADEPNVPPALLDHPKATLLPHVGSATVETRQAMTDLAIANLVEFLRTGKARTPVPECRHL